MRWFAAFYALVIALLCSASAEAHAVGLSRGTYRVADGEVQAELVLARSEIAALASGLDVGALVIDGVRVSADGACAGEVVDVRDTDQDGVAVDVKYTCPRGARVHVDLTLLDVLTHGHRHIARVEAADVQELVLFRGASSFDAVAGGASLRGQGTTLLAFVRMGIEHILTGYDHLVFLFALVLVGGRLRSILLVVSAFTVAHSITLAMAVLGAWTPPPSFVEPAIALSIAYVGVENFVLRRPERRWRVTFAFGLVHGFGFAGALTEIAIPRADIAGALVGFNAGVELGQLGVLAIALPCLAWMRRAGALSDRTVRALSASVAAAGVVWFVARVV